MEMVFDSSTLILLAKIDLLRESAEDISIVIPPKVKEECLFKESLDALLIKTLAAVASGGGFDSRSADGSQRRNVQRFFAAIGLAGADSELRSLRSPEGRVLFGGPSQAGEWRSLNAPEAESPTSAAPLQGITRLQPRESAPAEVPLGWLTCLVLDKRCIIV